MAGYSIPFYYLEKKRPLILGSYITYLAIKLGVLDLKNKNMRIACEMERLDMDCLEKNGGYRKMEGFASLLQDLHCCQKPTFPNTHTLELLMSLLPPMDNNIMLNFRS